MLARSAERTPPYTYITNLRRHQDFWQTLQSLLRSTLLRSLMETSTLESGSFSLARGIDTAIHVHVHDVGRAKDETGKRPASSAYIDAPGVYTPIFI